MMINKVLSIFLVTFPALGKRIDYCNPRLCPPPQFHQHTACHNNARFSQKCVDNIEVVRLTEDQKILLVTAHNYYRLQVAMGQVGTYISGTEEFFPTATRMMELVWDEEEAVLALLQLKTCLSHDSCHNSFYNSTSRRLTMSGQNIAEFYTYGDQQDTELYIFTAVTNWFHESQVTPLDVIDSLYYTPNYTIGHFTQLIHDKNTRVGCAMVIWSEQDVDYPEDLKKSTRITCNYLKANYMEQPVYDEGDLCSACEVCDEDVFIGLCLA